MNRRHPLPDLRVLVAALLSLGGASGVLAQTLPYELRQISSRYPVTLYSGESCAPCDAGRQLLVTRGVPFSERTVNTPADGAALRALTGGSTLLPVLTIGQQRLQGFARSNWSDYLDAAGYPRTSQLPLGYRRPEATPLAEARQKAATPATTPSLATPPQPAPVPGPSPDNPAGIQF